MIKKIFKMTLTLFFGMAIPVTALTVLFFYLAPQIGAAASGERLKRMQASKHYRQGKFINPVSTSMDMSAGEMAKTLWQVIRGDEARQPKGTIETRKFDKTDFMNASDSEMVVSWFGHSSVLFKIDGKVILADPVFSERASMFSFMGPKRFDYTHHMSVAQLPPVDFVIISHDHYDHLDYETILALESKVGHYYVPLGVGAHLEHWGVPSAKITELDWWQSAVADHEMELVFTPTRHFSGRAFRDRFNTLWGSWVIKGKKQRIYFGGDSGYFPGFKEIGEKYGPFDLTLLECGQYNERWANIHMMPEETVQAHKDLRGKILMPIHWGKFTLSLHPWKEPVQRVDKAAETEGIEVAIPVVGTQMVIYSELPEGLWWKAYQ